MFFQDTASGDQSVQSSGAGGAMEIESSSVTLTNSIFYGNTAFSGPGLSIINPDQEKVVVTNCTFLDSKGLLQARPATI